MTSSYNAMLEILIINQALVCIRNILFSLEGNILFSLEGNTLDEANSSTGYL